MSNCGGDPVTQLIVNVYLMIKLCTNRRGHADIAKEEDMLTLQKDVYARVTGHSSGNSLSTHQNVHT